MSGMDPNDPGKDGPQDDREFVGAWLTAIKDASDEEKDWYDDATKACEVYRGGPKSNVDDFNLFHANVETIVPALYNSDPVPDARKRWGGDDPQAKNLTDILERAITYALDTQDFRFTMRSAVQDLVITSRGIVRVVYDPGETEGTDTTELQQIKFEYVPWRRFRRGPATDWTRTPWIAFEHYLSKEEIAKIADNGINPEELAYEYSTKGRDDEEGAKQPDDKPRRRALVWEIWDAKTRTVLFIAECYPQKPLTVRKDPLELVGFYPTPRPMLGPRETDSLVPVTSYSINESLYDGVAKLARRLDALTDQCRPRAGVVGDMDLTAVAMADDGELVPMMTLEQFLNVSQGNQLNLNSLISWFPLDETIRAIEVLSARLEDRKQELYEVTGISDIIRGATDPRETLGAQEIKNQWGSVRVRESQLEVQRYVRDLFRIAGELYFEQFPAEVLTAMTGIEVTPDLEALMMSETSRSFRIDMETDSTIQGDLTRNQGQMEGFLNATAKFIQTVTPAVQAGVMPPQIVIELYMSFARQFRLGKQAEDALEELAKKVRDNPENPDPQAGEREAEQGKQAIEMQKVASADKKIMLDAQYNAAKLEVERESKMAQAAHNAAMLEIEKARLEHEGIDARSKAIDAATRRAQAHTERLKVIGGTAAKKEEIDRGEADKERQRQFDREQKDEDRRAAARSKIVTPSGGKAQ